MNLRNDAVQEIFELSILEWALNFSNIHVGIYLRFDLKDKNIFVVSQNDPNCFRYE